LLRRHILGEVVTDNSEPLLIKRYASRRLYNTETSDYVTLEDIAGFIRSGRDVQIVDLKSGDDLTRQYLLQIIAEHESRGESVLPVALLNDLVRGYTSEVQSVVPQFLAMSFDLLREGQTKMMEKMANPMSSLPGFEAMQAQQKAFMNAMTGGIAGSWSAPEAEAESNDEGADDTGNSDELDEIKQQLAALQAKLSKL
jgi:polyhydroxyalkanoate synthesis repressor PhaR